jgi:acetyltransferase-like isoleucine patch superfamily enzyme
MEIININSSKKSINNVKVGKNVKFFDYVNLYNCEIGENTKIGTFVEIQKGAFVGKNCKISSHSFICEGVHIKDNCFIGHGVMFTNDLLPRATNFDGTIQNEDDWNLIETFVEKGASIGSNVTILCGIKIGENSLIGAGSVVVKDVPKNTIVVGNPAKVIKKL